MNTNRTQQTLERLSALLRSESRALLNDYGLQPVQYEALYYLSVSNRYSNTAKAVTEFLGQTKGTISQTLKVLEKKGLISRQVDDVDKRISHLLVTPAGQALIKQLRPSPILNLTCQQLEVGEFDNINQSLTRLLSQLQAANQFKTFGQCHSCIYNVRVSKSQFLCDLTREPLSKAETGLICREHLENINSHEANRIPQAD